MKTTRTVALASLLAFATQVAFALLMLRLFTPQEVGEFSVISQIGFFWMTLALAQSNLSLLANQHVPALLAARQAWRASALRGLCLLPVAALAVWFSRLSLWPALVWALLLAFCQMAWMLAQSLTLRTGSTWQQAMVRVLPPATAAASALIAAFLGASIGWDGPVLLLGALLGYALGATWLVPAFGAPNTRSSAPDIALTNAKGTEQSDPRSARLRMAHTLVDALLATTIILVWQRLYGAEETGLMAALLRVLGFVPTLVHLAWAQVALAEGGQTSAPHLKWVTPGWIGLGAFGCVIILGVTCAIALHLEWLEPKWQDVRIYIAPLVLWQGSACISAAFSHRPFQTRAAEKYSLACIALAVLQGLVLIMPMNENIAMGAQIHLIAFSLFSSLGLLGLAAWLAHDKSV